MGMALPVLSNISEMLVCACASQQPPPADCLWPLQCTHSDNLSGITDDRATVVYKRPTDLALLKDVAICCNLLVCDIMDDGALPLMSHAV